MLVLDQPDLPVAGNIGVGLVDAALILHQHAQLADDTALAGNAGLDPALREGEIANEVDLRFRRFMRIVLDQPVDLDAFRNIDLLPVGFGMDFKDRGPTTPGSNTSGPW